MAATQTAAEVETMMGPFNPKSVPETRKLWRVNLDIYVYLYTVYCRGSRLTHLSRISLLGTNVEVTTELVERDVSTHKLNLQAMKNSSQLKNAFPSPM
jgi:hypothetical protein